jgi:1,2-diacylglycerol 3-alpha-glucosyltransferase
MSKRIAIVWDYYLHYHLARLRALTQHASGRAWEVTGFAVGAGGAKRDSHLLGDSEDGDNPVVRVLCPDGDIYSSAAARKLVAALDILNPDAVCLPGYGSRVARAAVRWCRTHRKGAVMMFESQERDFPRVWWKEWFKRRVVRSADCAFCGGQSHARYAHKLGFPSDRIFLGYSVVDNAFWQQATDSARQSSPPIGAPYFLALGRFVAKKNFAGLVTAFSDFRRETSIDWHLVIIGGGPERASIQAEIERHRLQDQVHLPGYCAANITAGWMAHAGAFVMPSSREEQWGLVVNEAMAAGLPVAVSSACGCVEDLVENGKTGLVFTAADQRGLTEALARLALDGKLRLALARAGRDRVARFSPAIFASQAITAAETAVEIAASRP